MLGSLLGWALHSIVSMWSVGTMSCRDDARDDIDVCEGANAWRFIAWVTSSRELTTCTRRQPVCTPWQA